MDPDGKFKLYFTKQELALRCKQNGINMHKDLLKRQETASRILNMGKMLDLSDHCTHTAVVYMHRFYVYHSFEKIHRYDLMNAALFLAAKVMDMPVTIEDVIKCCHTMLFPKQALDEKSEAFVQMRKKAMLLAEGDLLKTLGSAVEVEHTHYYIRQICQLVKICIDLEQAAYFLATVSLRKTTMCLQYKPRLIACMCVHFACKWAEWKINPSIEGKEWYHCVDKNYTLELLEKLYQEFYGILKNYPHLLGGIPRKLGANGNSQKNASNAKHHSKDKLAVTMKDGNSASPRIVGKPASFRVENGKKYPVSSPSVYSPQTPKSSQSDHSPQTPKENKPVPHSLSLEAYHKRKGNKQHKPKLPAESTIQQQVVNKALNDQDRVNKHASSNSLDLHSKSKPLVPPASVSVSSCIPQSTAATMGLTNSLDVSHLMLANPIQLANPFVLKHPVPAKNAEPVSVDNSRVVKHHSHKRKPSEDINTNGSKETNYNKRRKAVVENNVVVKTPEMSHKKYDSKLSYKSPSEDKVVNSVSSIMVRIPLKKISRLPPKKTKSQSSDKVGSTKPLFNTSKLPVPPNPVAITKPNTLKIVISKDKSGIYRTFCKNERLNRDRATGGRDNFRKLLKANDSTSHGSPDYIDVETLSDEPCYGI